MRGHDHGRDGEEVDAASGRTRFRLAEIARDCELVRYRAAMHNHGVDSRQREDVLAKIAVCEEGVDPLGTSPAFRWLPPEIAVAPDRAVDRSYPKP